MESCGGSQEKNEWPKGTVPSHFIFFFIFSLTVPTRTFSNHIIEDNLFSRMGQAYDSDDESTTDVSETGRDLEEKKVEEARRRQRELLVGKETKVIVRFQRMVFAFLAVIALACSLSTFYILENEKILDLEDQVS